MCDTAIPASARTSPVAVIINPTAGPSRRRAEPAERAELARRICVESNLSSEVVFTEHAGHGRTLAAELVRRGCSPIIAWGGDGTVNEVASALAFQDAALGIVPSGSGNGFARELGISARPERALVTALRGRERTIDVGELDGRFFVNLAGVGLDASVAHLFSRLAGRGLLRYVLATLRQLGTYVPEAYTITTEGKAVEETALLVELANGREYGNGALIAPRARLDDGRLDLVVVRSVGRWRTLWGFWRLFNGTIDRHPRVHTRRVGTTTIAARRPIRYHVDGEPAEGGISVTGKVHPGALRVRVPDPGQSA